MSGFEVVGIVLGTIPLIISAIEKYKAVGSPRKYARELNSLRRSLAAELEIFEGICEKLLTGMVADTDIENMIREPFGSLWQDEEINKRIRLRLWKSYISFEGTVQDMVEALDQLSTKLGSLQVCSSLQTLQRKLTSMIQAKSSASSSIAGGLERLKFAFNRSQYAEMLKVLGDGNATLHRLVSLGTSHDVESSRRIRSTARFFTLKRMISPNVFNAVRYSLSSHAAVSHFANLRLQLPSVHPTPCEDDDTVIRQIPFRLNLMHNPEDHQTKQPTWQLDNVELRAQGEQPPKDLSVVAGNPTLHVQQKKGAHFAFTPSKPQGFGMKTQATGGLAAPHNSMGATLTSTSVGAALGMPGVKGQARDIVDLRQAIEEDKASVNPSGAPCYGYVTDKSAPTYNKFGVYPDRQQPGHDVSEEWPILSLHQVLDRSDTSLPPLSFRHKQMLAATIASNVLQLAKSPWLAEVFDARDINFLNLDGGPSYDDAFVSKRMTQQNQPHSAPDHSMHQKITQNSTIFSLGIVLLELALGKRLGSIRNVGKIESSSSQQSVLSDYETALQHLDAVRFEVGQNYYDAVRRCIKCEFMHPTLDLGDDEFRREIYVKVVELLEENCKTMNSSTKAFY
ncbi:hypothetical protein PG996_011385 [Apiospora saccharicola]|uniref:DUF7580 domain-containing protein n=1 Tax=Apiospora saccharicola TaxID=335842 RepID=A0ABR1UEW9_9PEZI